MELHLRNHRNGKLVLHFIEYPHELEQDTEQEVSCYGLKKKDKSRSDTNKKGELEVNEAKKTLNTFVSVLK